MYRLFLRRVAPCCAAMWFAVAAFAADPTADAVARLGTTDIPSQTLREFARGLDPSVRKQALADPAVLNRLVRQELARIAVLNEAAAKKWEQRPDVIARIARAREDAIVGSYLASLTAPEAGFPTDAQVQAAYDANRDSFMAPRQYKLEQIFIALPAGADKAALDATQKKAEDLARKAKVKGANFAELARANSDNKQNAERGGDTGWAAENLIVPEIRSQIAGLGQGDISDPIRAPGGWHIIHLIDTKPAAPRPLAEVRDSLIAALKQRKMQENEQTYLAALLEKTPISVNEIGLRKIFEAAP